jgi:hypothetical protein
MTTTTLPNDPVRIGRFWHWPDGTKLPVVSGGSDDGGAGSGGDGGAGGGTGTQTQEPPRTFTQDEVNAFLAKEKRKYADYDDLKTKAAKADELEQANASELEKAVKKAREEAEAAARADERSKADLRIIKAEVKAAAGTKLNDPMDAVRMLDLADFTVDEDGDVDPKAIAAALDKLLKEKPYLAASNTRRAPGVGQGDRPGVQMTAAEKGRAEAQKRYGTGDKK